MVRLAFSTGGPWHGLTSPQDDSVNSRAARARYAREHAVGTFQDARHSAQFFILSPEAMLGPACHLLLMAEEAKAQRIIKVTQKARNCHSVLPIPQQGIRNVM